MRREYYSGKKQVVSVNIAGVPHPLRGLSDADDAIMIALDEETFGQAQVDLSGKNSQHVENSSRTPDA